MELISTFNIRVFKIHNKTVIIQLKIKPCAVKYHYGTAPVCTTDWLHPEDWTAIIETIELTAIEENCQFDSNWQKHLNVRRHLKLKIKKKNTSKEFCRCLNIAIPNDNVILLGGTVSNQDEAPSSRNLETSKQNNYFLGFVDGNMDEPENDVDFENILDEELLKDTPVLKDFETPDVNRKTHILPMDTGNELMTKASTPVLVHKAVSNDAAKPKTRKIKSEAERLIDSLSKKELVSTSNKRESARKAKIVYSKNYDDSDIFESTHKTPLKARKKHLAEVVPFIEGQSAYTDAIEQEDNTTPNADMNEGMQLQPEADDIDVHNSRIQTPLINKTPGWTKKRNIKNKRKLHDIPARSDIEPVINEACDEAANNCKSETEYFSNITKSAKSSKGEKSKATKVTKKSPVKSVRNEIPNSVNPNEIVELNYHSKIQDEIDEFLGTTTARADNLTLEDISSADIINTFDRFKPILDVIFMEERYKCYVSSWKGINHFLVMHLTESCTQMKLMQKLCDVYESNKAGPSAYTTLFANAMMPEWLVNVLMEKYNLSRTEVLQRLQEIEKL